MDVCKAIEEAVVDVTIEAEEGVIWTQGKKLTGGEIAAIVIVLLLGIVVVVLLLFFLVFRRRYGRGSDSFSGDTTGEVTSTEAVAGRYGTEFGLWESEAPSQMVIPIKTPNKALVIW